VVTISDRMTAPRIFENNGKGCRDWRSDNRKRGSVPVPGDDPEDRWVNPIRSCSTGEFGHSPCLTDKFVAKSGICKFALLGTESVSHVNTALNLAGWHAAVLRPCSSEWNSTHGILSWIVHQSERIEPEVQWFWRCFKTAFKTTGWNMANPGCDTRICSTGSERFGRWGELCIRGSQSYIMLLRSRDCDIIFAAVIRRKEREPCEAVPV
jgi:hypothetical protein